MRCGQAEIAMVARVYGGDKVLFGVGEELEAGGCGIETEKAESGTTLLAGGEIERQSFDREAGFAGAQIREPDEPERQDRGGIALGWAGDGCPSMLAMAQERAWEGQGEAEGEIWPRR